MIPAILWALVLVGAGLATCMALTVALTHRSYLLTAGLFALMFGVLATVAAWRVGEWISRLGGAVGG